MIRYVSQAVIALAATLMAISSLGTSCGGSALTEDTSVTESQVESLPLDANGRPVGWTEATHSKSTAPDYATVFPQGQVGWLDIAISASDWQTMLDDMTTNYGAFGAGGQGGGMPGLIGGDGNMTLPSGMTDACAALQEGDACSVTFNGMTIEGACTAGTDGQLICRPQMQPGDFPGGQTGGGVPLDGQGGGSEPPTQPTGMPDACSSLQEGDTCSMTMNGVTIEGTCTAGADGQLTCRSGMDPGAGGGMPGGGGMLGNDDTNPVVVPCTVAFDGNTWWYVGIRFKGLSSLMSTWSSGIYKLPFRLDLDAFDDEHPEIADQRFYGFEKLSLASNWSDPTYLREKVTHDIFREAGVPAPRTAFCRLYLDVGEGPVYFGLYAMTEIPDNPMLETQFGDDSGNLYKPTSNWVSFNQDDFDKESNKDEADWSDVQAAIASLHADRSDAAAWRAGLEAVFNVDGFLRWLAVNTVIVNWDTYGRMAHNYYLYANPADEGRLTWIPWDNNMAFMAGMGGFGGGGGIGGAGGADSGLSLGLSEVGETWPLIRYLMDDPVYQAAYVSHMRAFVEEVFDVASIQARFQAEHDLIAPYVTGVEGEQAGYTLLNDPQEFDTGLTNLLQFVADRSAAAIEFLSTQP